MDLVNKWEIWDLNPVSLVPEFMHQTTICFVKANSILKESSKASVFNPILQKKQKLRGFKSRA